MLTQVNIANGFDAAKDNQIFDGFELIENRFVNVWTLSSLDL